MAQKKRVVKRKRKSSTIAMRLVVCTVMLVAAGFLLWPCYKELKLTVELAISLHDTQAQLTSLTSENEALTSQITKMQDDKYTEMYAEGDFMLIKNGDEVYTLPSKDNTQAEPSD